MVIVAIVLNAAWLDGLPGVDTTQISFLGPVIVFLSVLMISPIRFEAPPRPSADLLKREPRKALLYAASMIVMILRPREGVLLIFAVYLSMAMVRAFLEAARALKEGENGEKDDASDDALSKQ
jgi:phosphatidylserine synthase